MSNSSVLGTGKAKWVLISGCVVLALLAASFSFCYRPTVAVAMDGVKANVVVSTHKPHKGRVSWRHRALHTLVQEGIYTRSNYELLVHCVMRESGGHADARNGQYLGVLQFGRSWKGTYKQKTSVEWSFHRWCHVLKKAGKHGIYKHWCKWHGCGRHY
jgi:hypothetical protein